MMRSRLAFGLLAVLAACSDESPATGDESSSSSGGEETSTASSVGTTLTTSATLDTTADTSTAADTSESSSEDSASESSSSEGGGTCGNDVVEPGEACDGDDLDGQDCVSQGFIAGALACSASCTFDYAACSNCGDGNQGGTEVCDGSDVADA